MKACLILAAGFLFGAAFGPPSRPAAASGAPAARIRVSLPPRASTSASHRRPSPGHCGRDEPIETLRPEEEEDAAGIECGAGLSAGLPAVPAPFDGFRWVARREQDGPLRSSSRQLRC